MALNRGVKEIDHERMVAYSILRSVEEEGSFSNLEINRALSKEEEALIDKAFVRKLVYGILERKLYLDYMLDSFLKKGVDSVKADVLQILRMGAYQLEFMEGVPDYAAIHTSVELLPKKYGGLKGFVNGVLRSYQRMLSQGSLPDLESLGKEERLSIRYSCGREIVDLLINQYGYEETKSFLKELFDEYPLELRVNLGKRSREEILDLLDGAEPSKMTKAGITYSNQGERPITETREYIEGLISIQSLGSCRIAEKSGAKAGDNIVDVCSAPGGKSLAMAEAMENQGKIISMDLSGRRLSLLPKEAERLGIDIIETRVWDGSMVADDLVGWADIVLVDAPCSGLGVMGTKPEIKYKDIEDGMAELIELQQNILEASSNYLKKGGRLIYSTCTLNKKENQEQIERFLKNHSEYKLIEEQLPLRDKEGRGRFYLAVMEK